MQGLTSTPPTELGWYWINDTVTTRIVRLVRDEGSGELAWHWDVTFSYPDVPLSQSIEDLWTFMKIPPPDELAELLKDRQRLDRIFKHHSQHMEPMVMLNRSDVDEQLRD